jgi:hypothetical protein
MISVRVAGECGSAFKEQVPGYKSSMTKMKSLITRKSKGRLGISKASTRVTSGSKYLAMSTTLTRQCGSAQSTAITTTTSLGS